MKRINNILAIAAVLVLAHSYGQTNGNTRSEILDSGRVPRRSAADPTTHPINGAPPLPADTNAPPSIAPPVLRTVTPLPVEEPPVTNMVMAMPEQASSLIVKTNWSDQPPAGIPGTKMPPMEAATGYEYGTIITNRTIYVAMPGKAKPKPIVLESWTNSAYCLTRTFTFRKVYSREIHAIELPVTTHR